MPTAEPIPAPEKLAPKRLAYVVSSAPKAQIAYAACKERYGEVPFAEAEAIVVLGGDGTMLNALHEVLKIKNPVPIFGINYGTVGFLLNPNRRKNLLQRIAEARTQELYPLRMVAIDKNDRKYVYSAFNEVSIFRGKHSSISVRILINGKKEMNELVCDGVLVATPAGSSAYNHSAHGPILPLDSKLLALTPISPFRPRRWHGAILPHSTRISFRVNNPERREVYASADSRGPRKIKEVNIVENKNISVPLLFDADTNLSERILREQFSF